MESESAKKAARRRRRLAVERLESREVPTAPTLLSGYTGAVNLRSLAAQTESETPAPVRVPTRRELAHQAFVARFAGPYNRGPGRFTDQASEFFFKGGGGSSAFLHGDLQMAIYTPKDPSGQTTGLAALIVKNVTNSGNLLVLDLQGDAQSIDRKGRPTRMTWTVDGSSGGTFSGATGEGTVEVRYRSSGVLAARKGIAGVIFRGRIETNNGVTDLLRT